MPSRKHRHRVWELYAQDPRCWFCGLGFPPFPLTTRLERKHAEPTIEHLLPRSKGGTGRWENTVLAHMFCNGMAADRTPEEKLRLREILRAAIAELASADESGGRGMSRPLVPTGPCG